MGRLLLYWDPEIDSAFRRRLERALGELHVDYADAGMVDPDPDERKLMKMALVSSRGGFAPPQDSDLIVLAGPGEFSETGDALRIEASDIEYTSKRWTGLLDRLGKKMGRESLAISPEDLAIKLDEATRRADGAERMRAEFELQRNNAVRTARQTASALASAQAELVGLRLEVGRLTAVAESTAFSLSQVKDDLKDVVTTARDHAWRARLAAARAAEMGEAHPDALSWPKAQASYAGETRNRMPHGHGVIVFRKGAEDIAHYTGAFTDGRREGHGIATSEDGMIWTGEMKDNEACGFGILEAGDGRRFEGEVAPDADGAPRQVRGHQWDAKAAIRLKAEAHRQVATALPSPRAAGG
jgi:hypothetical protein